MRKTMTNEQRVLAYLFTVPYIKRKQLSVALPDMPYQCLTRAVRTALEHGHVECITVARCKAIRLTKEGTRHIRSVAGDGLDKAQRRAATVNADVEGKRRFERRETARNLCPQLSVIFLSLTYSAPRTRAMLSSRETFSATACSFNRTMCPAASETAVLHRRKSPAPAAAM